MKIVAKRTGETTDEFTQGETYTFEVQGHQVKRTDSSGTITYGPNETFQEGWEIISTEANTPVPE